MFFVSTYSIISSIQHPVDPGMIWVKIGCLGIFTPMCLNIGTLKTVTFPLIVAKQDNIHYFLNRLV